MSDVVSLVVNPIVNQVIGDATSLIKKNYGLLQDVKEDVRKLESQLKALQAVLADAEAKQLDSHQIRDWLEKLQGSAYDAEDVLDTFATEAILWERKQEVRTLKAPVSSSKTQYKLEGAVKIKKVLARIDEIAKERENFHLDIKNETVPSEDRNTSYEPQNEIFGREDDKNKIVDTLLSEESNGEDNFSVIPIIGMGGLGKTTLAQLIYNDDRIKGHFEFRMWVCVTDKFDYKKILKDMIEYHTEMKSGTNLSDTQLRSRLLEFLRGKSFLLVLDDVWTEDYDDWEKLQGVLRQGGKGCKALITTRSTGVSDVMGTLDPYPLDCLPEEQCWSLFKKVAFTPRNSRVNHNNLEDIGKEIVRKCNGLPLAVKAMGGLLRGNSDVNKWRSILQHEIWEAEDREKATRKQSPKILPALKLSYDHLPSNLRQCFAFCYIFPKAYVFHKLELVKIWKAVSLIVPVGNCTTDETGIEYFDALLRRSFFQLSMVDDKETYRMHDLHHDLAQFVSRPYCYQVKDNGACDIPESVRYVSLLCKDVQRPIMEVIDKSKRLRTILSPGEYLRTFENGLDSIFCALKYIRALDLSSSTILELPESVGELKLIRYLDLSRTEIRKLPNSIGNLYNLQTLKLLGCHWLFELPKDLGNLVNLQHLELDEMFWFKLTVLPPKMGKLIHLQNLHTFPVIPKKGCGIDELEKMSLLEGTLHISRLENAVDARQARLQDKQRLKKVIFEWSDGKVSLQDEAADHGRILEDLRPHPDIKEIQILYYKGNEFPSWIRDGLAQNLVTLTLKHCRNCRVLPLGRLQHLRQLYIKGLLELEEWSGEPQNYLSRLTISNCPKLRDLPQHFLNLHAMKIKKCDSLKTLPLAPFLKFLILIDNLSLEDFKETTIGLIVLNNQGQHVAIQKHSFIDLLELKITNCPMLVSLPQVFAPQKLEISGCSRLATLPACEFSQRLQHLAIDACSDILVTKIPDTTSLYSVVISNISSLTSFPKWPRLPGLKVLYIRGCKDLVSLSEEEAPFQGLNSLELLSVRDCPKIVTLPDKGLPASLKCLTIASCANFKSLGPKELLKSLVSLKDLYLEHCPELQLLTEEELPASVQHLHIEGCPKLIQQCQKESGPGWPKFEHIPDLEAELLEAKTNATPGARHFKFFRGKNSGEK